MDADDPVVTISVKEYESLKKDVDKLRKLENAGVDNWEWYDEAIHHPESYE